MGMNLIVPEDGSLEQQELQYLKGKMGSNILLSMYFYKDRFHAYPWNLANPVQFNVRAKTLKSLNAYVFNKNKASSDIILTNASAGRVDMVLNSTDVTAFIHGDQATFTGTPGDKIKVTIDDIEYDDIDVSACASLADVAAAINTAVGRIVASVAGYYFSTTALGITSLTSGDESNVTIEDGHSTGNTCVGRLFSVAGDRTVSGSWGNLSIAQTLYVEVEFQPNASSRIYKTGDIIFDVVETVE